MKTRKRMMTVGFCEDKEIWNSQQNNRSMSEGQKEWQCEKSVRGSI